MSVLLKYLLVLLFCVSGTVGVAKTATTVSFERVSEIAIGCEVIPNGKILTSCETSASCTAATKCNVLAGSEVVSNTATIPSDTSSDDVIISVTEQNKVLYNLIWHNLKGNLSSASGSNLARVPLPLFQVSLYARSEFGLYASASERCFDAHLCEREQLHETANFRAFRVLSGYYIFAFRKIII